MEKHTLEATSVFLDIPKSSLIRVLHVDDEEGLLRISKQLLPMEGEFQVDTASSVEEATKKLGKASFDVVVSDYKMPEKDGLDFLKQLRQTGNNTPFIMFTGKGREEVAVDALNLGADQYINKIGDPKIVYRELAYSIIKAVDRKRAKEKLRESEEKFRCLVEDADVSIGITDLKGKFNYVNKALTHLLGYTTSEMLERNFKDFLHPKDKGKIVRQFLKIILLKRQPREIEFRALHKEGRVLHLRSKPTRFTFKGKTLGFQAIILDAKNPQRSGDSENKYKAIFEKSVDGIISADPKTKKLLFANTRMCKLTGYSLEELAKLRIDDIHPKPDLPRVIEQFTEQVQGERELAKDIPVLRKDGKVIYCDVNSVLMKIDDQDCMVGFFRDNTEWRRDREERNILYKNLEERVKELQCLYRVSEILNQLNISQEKILQNIVNILPSAWRFPEITCARIIFENQEYKTKNFNKSKWKQWADIKINGEKKGNMEVYYLEEKTQEGEDSFLKEEKKLLTIIAESLERTIKRKRIEEALRNSEERLKQIFEYAPDAYYLNDLKGNFIDGNKAAEEITGYNKSELIGKSFLKLKLLPRSQLLKATKLLAKNAIGEPTGPDEFILSRKNGRHIPVEIRTYPTKIDGRKLVLGIARDISERKNTELQLRSMNEKLSVVGKLTRHDVRNKLSTVTGNIYLARRKLLEDHEVQKYLEEIKAAIKQTEHIFDFAREYEKLGIEMPEYINIEHAINEARQLFSELFNITVSNECKKLNLLADSMVSRLFYNLIDNSLRHGGKVKQVRIYFEKTKEGIKLVYEDNGVGIPKNEKTKIFQEGYGRGSGYGLYLIKRMCEGYGWTIKETGKQGKGAKFTIVIPETNIKGAMNYKLA